MLRHSRVSVSLQARLGCSQDAFHTMPMEFWPLIPVGKEGSGHRQSLERETFMFCNHFLFPNFPFLKCYLGTLDDIFFSSFI